jgi:hypothetical protein
MSETTEQAEQTEAQAPEAQTTTEPESQTQEAAEQTEGDKEQSKRESRGSRHVAQLTARLATIQANAEAAERRAAAAEALLNARREGGENTTQNGRTTVDPVMIREEARKLNEAEQFSRRISDVVEAGRKEYGQSEFDNFSNLLHGMGATGSPAFMEALADLPNAPRVVAALAEDPDMLADILSKSPTAMATRLGKLDAKMETAAAPVTSKAPAPPTKLAAIAVAREPDINDPNLSMKEWAALWDKQAPRHLRGMQ